MRSFAPTFYILSTTTITTRKYTRCLKGGVGMCVCRERMNIAAYLVLNFCFMLLPRAKDLTAARAGGVATARARNERGQGRSSSGCCQIFGPRKKQCRISYEVSG